MAYLPTYFVFIDTNGNRWYMFAENDGTVRIHNAVPTNNYDGVIVGLQFVTTPSTDLENPSLPPENYLEMISPNGTKYYLYVANRLLPTSIGALMIHTDAPSRNDDGSSVGLQF